MLKLPQGARIFMAVKPVDMRRSFDGLCATITERWAAVPCRGICTCFAANLPIGSRR